MELYIYSLFSLLFFIVPPCTTMIVCFWVWLKNKLLKRSYEPLYEPFLLYLKIIHCKSNYYNKWFTKYFLKFTNFLKEHYDFWDERPLFRDENPAYFRVFSLVFCRNLSIEWMLTSSNNASSWRDTSKYERM